MNRAREAENVTGLFDGALRTKWAQAEMTDDDRAWVDGVMRRAVARMGGEVTAANVERLVRSTTVSDRFRGCGAPSGVDVGWSWVALQQEQGSGWVHASVCRKSHKGWRTQPTWGWYAMVRSGWRRPQGMGPGVLRVMKEADRLLSLLWLQGGVD